MIRPLVQPPLMVGGDVLYAVLSADLHTPDYTDTPTLSNGSLTYTQSLGMAASALGTIACSSGQRHFEVHRDVLGNLADTTQFGVCETDGTIVAYATGYTTANYIGGFVNDGNGWISYGSYFDGTYGFLFDLTAETLELRKNGVAVFTRSLAAHGPLVPFIRRACNPYEPNRAVSVETFNFGQNPWAYAPGGGWSGWSKEI